VTVTEMLFLVYDYLPSFLPFFLPSFLSLVFLRSHYVSQADLELAILLPLPLPSKRGITDTNHHSLLVFLFINHHTTFSNECNLLGESIIIYLLLSL
jgi:hypothetical protein